MDFQSTPNANRTRIALFGRRNVGKSSLINALTEQPVSIVSNVAGTTTDPVQKTMELLPLGPVVLYDTAGIDDLGELGEQRVKKTMNILKTVDIALLVTDQMTELTTEEQALFEALEKQATSTIVIHNKIDDNPPMSYKNTKQELWVSAQTGQNIDLLRQTLASMKPIEKRPLISDLIDDNAMVLLVVPIDESAPKGRLILPQQQIIRDLLDHHAMAIVSQVDQIPSLISTYGNSIQLVITDSQVFKDVNTLLPKTMPLTSFSILFARFKGVLDQSLQGVSTLDSLAKQDTILICEGCTHKRQCNDIGTVKIPKWIQNYTQKELNFEYVSGNNFPDDLSPYSLIVHCGGCMLHENIMQERQEIAKKKHIPFTNYGLLIAKLNGILDRSIAPLQH